MHLQPPSPVRLLLRWRRCRNPLGAIFFSYLGIYLKVHESNLVRKLIFNKGGDSMINKSGQVTLSDSTEKEQKEQPFEQHQQKRVNNQAFRTKKKVTPKEHFAIVSKVETSVTNPATLVPRQSTAV
ncbi:hypothetical protein BV898_02417 [Hypsibius exemplaris]|uniref:Uncharacterized protein n=1 Tax=Hypsibius exemplaris TaxID=2072580 RepID=A0A1W0X830_HYPEX|nr:hypothetical protein BV898_02417 [Hypsibius exemplaris]